LNIENLKRYTHKNLGLALENEVNLSNKLYLLNNIAVIYKKPTPIQIVKVNYAKRSQALINEAYFKLPSTTDYNGVYKGYYLDFDCKEVSHQRYFSLSNLKDHQYEHLKAINTHHGIAFIILHIKSFDRYFILKFDFIEKFKVNFLLKRGYNYIPFDAIIAECREIFFNNCHLDYLDSLDL